MFGGLHKNSSQILAIIDFFKRRNYQKTSSVRKNTIANINLSQISCSNLDKFGVGNGIPDCRSATIGINYLPTQLGLARFFM